MVTERREGIPLTTLLASVLPDQSNVYITIISIIQCIALGFWVNEAKDIFLLQEREFDWLLALRLYVALIIIFVVWHRYVGQIQYLWPISWYDTMTPFLMGIIECMIVFASNTRKLSLGDFIMSIVMFQVMSILAYIDAYLERKINITIRLYQDFLF